MVGGQTDALHLKHATSCYLAADTGEVRKYSIAAYWLSIPSLGEEGGEALCYSFNSPQREEMAEVW